MGNVLHELHEKCKHELCTGSIFFLRMTLLLNRTLHSQNLNRSIPGNNKCVEGMLYQTHKLSMRAFKQCLENARTSFCECLYEVGTCQMLCKISNIMPKDLAPYW